MTATGRRGAGPGTSRVRAGPDAGVDPAGAGSARAIGGDGPTFASREEASGAATTGPSGTEPGRDRAEEPPAAHPTANAASTPAARATCERHPACRRGRPDVGSGLGA